MTEGEAYLTFFLLLELDTWFYPSVSSMAMKDKIE
jgi:hypothetical protein